MANELPRYVSAPEALKLIGPGERIFIHGSAATPVFMVDELANMAGNFKYNEVVSISVMGDFKIASPEYAS